jgi:hypothetical protein
MDLTLFLDTINFRFRPFVHFIDYTQVGKEEELGKPFKPPPISTFHAISFIRKTPPFNSLSF